MFIVAVSEKFKAPVQVKILGANGKPAQHKFVAEFRRPTQEERDEMDEAIVERAKLRQRQAGGQEVDENRIKELDDSLADQRIIDTYMTGWDEVMATATDPMEFNPDNLAKVLSIIGVRQALAKAFITSMDNKQGN